MFNEDDFLQVVYTNKEKSTGVIYVGKKSLEKAHGKELHLQAKTILQFELWQKLESSMKEQANEMLFNKSKTIEDMIAGKMVLYTLDMQRKKLEQIANLEF